jgi:tRNA (guanine37-N1)-methyltransferase
MKRVYTVESDASMRYVLLDDDKVTECRMDLLPPDLQALACEYSATMELYPLLLTYDNLSTAEVLAHYFPDKTEIPASFEQVGHLAHLNLREDYLSHKHLIGQVGRLGFLATAPFIYSANAQSYPYPHCH